MTDRCPGTLRTCFEPGLRELRRLWLPFFAIQLVGLCVVVSYFYVPSVTRWFDAVAEVKARVGLMFAALVMPVACGVVPEIFKMITGVDRRWDRTRVGFMVHNAVLFCVLGVTVEVFYRWLAATFGNSQTAGTIVIKTLLDQLGYSIVLAVPLIAFSFTLRRLDYSLGAATRLLGVEWYLRECMPILVTSWAYWFPMGLLMYTMPTTLTFIYGAIGSAASATLLTAIAGRKSVAAAPSVTAVAAGAAPAGA